MQDRRTTVVALIVTATAAAAAMTVESTELKAALGPAREPVAALVAQELLDAMREASGVPGMGAAAVLQGRLLWQGSSGWSDMTQHRPVDAETPFRLASVCKLFTATALARLAQDGLTHRRHCLQRERRPHGYPPAGAPSHPRSWQRTPLACRSTGCGMQAAASMPSAAHKTQRRHSWRVLLCWLHLGDYQYSSWGYTLLSAAIEDRSGLGFDDYLAHRITAGLDIAPDSIHLRPIPAAAGPTCLARPACKRPRRTPTATAGQAQAWRPRQAPWRSGAGA